MAGPSKRSISDFFHSTVSKKMNCSDDGNETDCGDIRPVHESIFKEEGGTDVQEKVDKTITVISESGSSVIGDISSSVNDGPRQPYLKLYPRTRYGKDFRSFQSDWYKLFPWLEYSIEGDAAFCFPCRFFSKEGRSDKNAFVCGYKNWKRALEKDAGFRKHENSVVHKTSVVSWDSYREMKRKGTDVSVVTQISEAYAAEVKENRAYIAYLSDILRFTVLQGIAQRGDDESSSSENKGNFLELLHLIANKDPFLKKRLENCPQNAKYTHHSVQNELLTIMANLILNSITNEVQKATCFALMVDESKDIRKVEQLSIVVRYYLNGAIYERFLGFHAAENLDAKSLFTYIKAVLAKCNIDIHKCVAQTYDGASVMSGHCNGVQALLQSEVPQATYIHCLNHKLNLVIVDVCKGIKSAAHFFDLLQMLYVFISGSKIHGMFIAVQKSMGLDVCELKAISDTRWASQITACIAIKKTFSAILVVLTNHIENRGNRSAEARGILEQLDFTFLFHLCMFCAILKDLKVISDFLQNEDCDIGNACIIVQANTERLNDMRNSLKEFQDLLTECKKLAMENGVDININTPRVRRLPQHLYKYIVTEQLPRASRGENLSNEEDLRQHIYIPILDRTISELNRRFTMNNPILNGISALHPETQSFLAYDVLKPFAEHYHCDTESLQVELKLISKTITRYESKNERAIKKLAEFVKFLEEFQLAFHEIYKLAVIALTIPSSSASCERSFSCMRRIKTYLRNRIANERLSSLAILSIERELTKNLNMDSVVDKFDALHNNRRINLH